MNIQKKIAIFLKLVMNIYFVAVFNNFILCYRLNNNYSLIKKFNISISERNSYLSINVNDLCATFIFMNKEDKVHDYKICIPKCNNKVYSFYNSLNENDSANKRLSSLFEVQTNNTYLRFDESPYDFGYFILYNIENTGESKKITNSSKINIKNDYIIDFVIKKKELINFSNITINYTVSVEYEEAYIQQCQIIFNFPFSSCYKSCETCSININISNSTNHNCIQCKENYYPSPIIETNCYMENEKEISWYLDSDKTKFHLCQKECKYCSGPSNNECLSCFNGSYLYLGHCQNHCELGYFAELIKVNNDYYYNCSQCYETCETCKEKGDLFNMKCEKCKENYIKNEYNCYEIVNSTIKSFYDPEYNNESSCYQKFNLYIKEDSNECIELPEIVEGYYKSNNITGLLSKCHENCLSCNNGIIKDNNKNLISMECLSCKDLNNINKTMIQFENNCFNIIQYEEIRIIFNITEINSNKVGSCLYFNKSIYYGQYKCIEKPDNTFYVLNGSENTGIIKDCSISCKSCYGECNDETTNCIECAQGYFKTEDLNTNCLKEELIPNNYYKNESNNICIV